MLSALHNEVWSCVWMGSLSKSTFLHQRDLEVWDSHDHPSFPSLYPGKCQESCIFFVPFCKIFTHRVFKKNVEKPAKIPTSTEPHNSLQVWYTLKACFVGLYFFGGQNENAWTFSSKKLSTPCKRFYLQTHCLVQCKTYCFISRQIWKWKAKRVIRKGKRVIFSRDQANIKLVFV